MASASLALPSRLNRRAGTLLVDGAALLFIISLHLYRIESPHDLAALVGSGLLCLLGSMLSRRVETGLVTGDTFRYRASITAATVSRPLTAASQVYLSRGETQADRGWRLALAASASDSPQVLDELSGLDHLSLRNVAEGLCKASGATLHDLTDRELPLVLPPSSLDLPLAERLARYPQLRLAKCGIPHGSGLDDHLDGDGRRLLRWHGSQLRASALLWCLGMAAVMLSGWLSSYDAAEFDVALVGSMAACAALAALLTIPVHRELVLTRGNLLYQLKWARLPLHSLRFAAAEIEEVRDLDGKTVEVVSDRAILALDFALPALTHYVAYQIQATLEVQEQAPAEGTA